MPLAADKNLTASDVQSLAGPDALVAFFGSLGYDTDERLLQSTAAMGISAESLQRKIRRIERVADQEDGLLQVYLVEVDSVTIAVIHGLARALRDRIGNYLLLFTSDYEHFDFVLLERQVAPAPATTISAPRVTVRPRILTVNRRDPDLVALRVLRRFSYTESDADAQYDKLLSAYTIAEWSEPLFNNRALFADYFLKQRLPAMPEWAEDPKPLLQQLNGLYASARDRLGASDERAARKGLIEPALSLLGFDLGKPEAGPNSPDYRLSMRPAPDPAIACLAYNWDRNLDGKDETRDTIRPAENPGARVVSVLDTGDWPWAIVTNGKLWRLYSAAAHSRATNYYEIDLEETLALPDPSDAIRYFWLLFRAASFRLCPMPVEGEVRQLSFVDELRRASGKYARELGDRLKDRVFEEVFPDLARGFIAHIQQLTGKKEVSQEQLDEVFRGTLTLLYRLLFLLYAEARDLLPVREQRGYWNSSLSKLKTEVAETAGPASDERARRLAQTFSSDPTKSTLYDRVRDLARIVDEGDPAVNTPIYSGGLFLTAPEPEDATPEASAARFLLRYSLSDYYLALALDRLARDLDEKRCELVAIDYKSLGVRQLGSIYEGLLEFKLRIAPEKMAVVKGKKAEEVVTHREAIREKRAILTEGRGRNAQERTLPKGAVYLENDRRERRASGSYYTPDHIVQYIVANAVGPVLKGHLEKLRPDLREAQQAYRDAQSREAAFQKKGMKGDDPEKVANSPRWQGMVDRLFEFRVLDPAMGSGHFLVEAVDFVTDRMLDFLNGFPWNPVQARLRQTREAILTEMERQGVTINSGKLTDVSLLKRHVLKRCIYGVDLNPMAVELAKVSLWLDCFTLGAPLSFLDHHLKWGNSLIGTTVQAVQQEMAAQRKGYQGDLFGGPFQGLLSATSTMETLAGIPDATIGQNRHSRGLFAEFEKAQSPYKAILDIWVSRFFGNTRAQEYLTLTGGELVSQINAGGRGLSPKYQQVISLGDQLKRDKRFFHWDLEFPEAFVDLQRSDWKPSEQQGFHVVIGNPPYDVLASEEIGFDIGPELKYFAKQSRFDSAIRGKNNLYKLFICQALDMIAGQGSIGMIVPMALLGDDQAREVRRRLLEEVRLIRVEAFPQKDDPRRRVFREAKLATTVFVCNASVWSNRQFSVRTHPAARIDANSPILLTTPHQVREYDPENMAICSCTQRDWDLATQIVQTPGIVRLGSVAESFQGEVNETNEGPKGTLSSAVLAAGLFGRDSGRYG